MALPALAKQKPAYTYEDGVMIDFQMVNSGKHCSTSADTRGDIDARTDDEGNTRGTVEAHTSGSTVCSNTRRAVYRVSVGEHVYTLEPYVGADRVAAAMVPIVGLAYLAAKKQSVLYGVLPGTHVEVRTESGAFYVRVGKRESKYRLAGAE